MSKLKLATALCLVPMLAFANKIEKVEVPSAVQNINAEFNLKLIFNVPEDKVACGITIDWGDGEKQKFRVGNGQQLKAPFTIPHTYKTTGQKKVVIGGEMMIRGLNTVSGCDVNFASQLTIQDPVEVAEKERLEKERIAERERVEKERTAERERVEKERTAERERVEKERLVEKERVDKERISELALADAARIRKRDQFNALLRNPKTSLGDKLAGACSISWPNPKEYAIITGNAAMDTCDESILRGRHIKVYAFIGVTRYVDSNKIVTNMIPSKGPSDQNFDQSIKTVTNVYTAKGDLMTRNSGGCITIDKVDVKFDTITWIPISVSGECDKGIRIALDGILKGGVHTENILRPN